MAALSTPKVPAQDEARRSPFRCRSRRFSVKWNIKWNVVLHKTVLPPVITPDLCVQIAGVRVLVVDDEADSRALVKRLLEDCKAIVTTAASASDAVERAQTDRPDVLVSDIGMPGEDGYSLMRRLRELGADRGGAVPALALTAYARAEDRMRSVVAGYQMHIAKPVEPAELITMVASLAGRTGKVL